MKDKVLIVSKTKMNNGHCCVGGITLNGRFVRLKDANGNNQPDDIDYSIRKLYEIDYKEAVSTVQPHSEDILVLKHRHGANLRLDLKIIDYIENNNIPIYRGKPDGLYQGLLNWSHSGSAYIDRNHIPEHSVAFWISDLDIIRDDYKGVRYRYPSTSGYRNFKFVGYLEPVDVIPAGTLIRVSLARWWKKDKETEERCYLQLSGWYE